MSVAVLISGALFKNPELKTSRAGKTYATASIRTASADNSAADFWNLLIFSETVAAELMRLSEGDKLAVQGSLKLEIYNGKISRTVFVDAILALRAPPREKKPKAKPAPPSQEQSTTTANPPDDDLNDSIPF
jgi:single-stranded DNA-binding protein